MLMRKSSEPRPVCRAHQFQDHCQLSVFLKCMFLLIKTVLGFSQSCLFSFVLIIIARQLIFAHNTHIHTHANTPSVDILLAPSIASAMLTNCCATVVSAAFKG